MKNIAPLVALFASLVLIGCSFESKTSLTPIAPSALATATGSGASPSQAPPSSGSSASASSSAPSPDASPLGGTWASPAIGGLPNISSCTNLQWQISNLSATSLAGSVSGVCGGSVTITANLTGELDGSDIANLTANGQAVALGIACGFSLSGVGHRETNDAVRLEYQGMTCLGPVRGTEILRRSSPTPPAVPTPASPEPPPAEGPAPAEVPVPATGDDVFGCTRFLPDRIGYVGCIHSHIRPTNEYSAFEVTKRVAWGLRGDGAGLLQKPGGENIVTWRGYTFAAARIMYPDGHIYKVLSDVGQGGGNGPSWQDEGFVEQSRYVPALNPALP